VRALERIAGRLDVQLALQAPDIRRQLVEVIGLDRILDSVPGC
jgi:hypothetical protein